MTPTTPDDAIQDAARRRFYLWLGGITLLALLLRLGVCGQLADQPAVANPHQGTDMATYKALAEGIAAGRFPDSFYYQPLYYAVFLPLIYALSGSGAWPVMLLQSLLGAATVWLTGLLGARLAGRTAGLVAAGLLALARYHIFFTPFLLFEVLSGFFLILLLWGSLLAYDRNTLRWWALTGLAAAVAILTRGNSVLLLPGLLALVVWRNRQTLLKRGLPALLLVLACCYLPQLPFSWHNYRHFQRWTGPSSAADAVLALGNSPESPPGSLEYPPTYGEWMRQANLPAAQRVPVAAQIRHWIRAEPLAWLELKFRMFLLFWNRMEIDNNITFVMDGAPSPLLCLPFLLDFALLGTFGLTGLFLLLARRRFTPENLYLVYALAVGCLSTVLFYILARFRIPLVPLICIFASLALVRLVEIVRDWQRQVAERRQIVVFLFCLLAAFFLVFSSFDLYCESWEKPVLRHARPNGVTVTLPGTVLVYDHGPLPPFGGWSPLRIPPGGLRLIKDFHLTRNLTGKPAKIGIEIPVYTAGGAELALTASVVGYAPREKTFTLPAENRLQGLQLPLETVEAVPEYVRCLITLKPLTDQSETHFFIDTRRDYGRTVFLPVNGTPEIAEAEACVRLVLLPPDPSK